MRHLNSAYVFKVVMGGITIFSRIQLSLSFSSLKTFLDRNEETLLESFHIAKKNVCSKLVLVSRQTF